MDPSSKPGLSIGEARGLNTNSPRGVTPAPAEATNAVLGHLGGWACAPSDRVRLEGVTGALYLGRANHLLVTRAADWGLFDGASLRPLPGAAPALTDTVTLAPGLAFSRAGGQYIHPSYAQELGQGALPAQQAPAFVFWDGQGDAPAGPHWYEVNGDFGRKEAVTLLLVGYPDPARRSLLSWVQRIDVPARETPRFVRFANIPPNWLFAVYDTLHSHADDAEGITHLRGFNSWLGRAMTFLQWGYGAESNRAGMVRGRLPEDAFDMRRIADLQPPAEERLPYLVSPDLAEYHDGRVWAAGGSTRNYNLLAPSRPLGEESGTVPGSRLYYSEIIAGFEASGGYAPLPEWREDNYIDVPFRVSERIVSVTSAGRYLYIFGDREVFVLNGNTDADFTLENIGDSIGAIATGSVQKLQGVVLYLSDTGVMALSGGQAQEVSRDVRNLVWNLNTATVTSTVDFQRDLYYLSDGAVTLVYNVRENGWTTRQAEGAGQRLLYGGGTPYCLHGGRLHSLDGGELRPMTLAFGPFDLGELLHRKQWDGLALTVDTDAPVQVEVTLTAHEHSGELSTDEATATLRPGTAPFLFSLGHQGTRIQGPLCSARLTLTPAAGSRRCILRPPLQFALKVAGQVMAGGEV